MSQQRQASGDESENFQAGRDLVVNKFEGLSADAYVILDRMVEKEVQRYTADALTEARSRYEEMYQELIERMASFDEDRLRKLSDPGVQADVIAAGDGYVRSGREDVKRSLIDLVTLRCGVEAGSLQGAVLSEAIEATRKITRAGINILTVAFLVGRVKNNGLGGIAEFEDWASTNLGPFIGDFPYADSEYEYLASTPAAYTSVSQINPLDAIRITYPGLFHKGLALDEVPTSMRELRESNPQLFMPSIHDPERLQPAALNSDVADYRCLEDGISEPAMTEYRSLLVDQAMPSHEVKQAIAENCPTWSAIVDTFEASEQLRSLRLTSVGIAIAHCNWTSRTGAPAPLSVWIPD